MPLERHFSSTTYIVRGNKVLLHKHKMLGLWLAVGGHLEPNETPDDAARREVLEETGLTVTILNTESNEFAGDDRVQLMIRPMHVLLEVLTAEHEHMDFIFYGTVAPDAEVELQLNEGEEFRWVGTEELDGFDAPPNVAWCAKEALRLLARTA